MDEINYQVEIENLLKIPEIKAYYEQNAYINKLPLYPLYNLLKQKQATQQHQQETQETQEIIMQRIEERKKKKEEEEEKRRKEEYQEYQNFLQEIKQQQPPPPHADPLHLYFIHNTRHFSLLKEAIKYQVFIDKLLIIISHEFLCYERNTIEITLDKLLEYLNISISKSSIDYIRRKLKSIKKFLIEKEFTEELTIKNSVLIVTLDTLYIEELQKERIITRIKKSEMMLQDTTYILKRVNSFYINNLKRNITDIKIDSFCAFVSDTNESRKKEKIRKLLKN